jgi:hypothetical protein
MNPVPCGRHTSVCISKAVTAAWNRSNPFGSRCIYYLLILLIWGSSDNAVSISLFIASKGKMKRQCWIGRDRAESAPAADSGWSEFMSRQGDRLSYLKCSLFLSVLPPNKCRNNISDYSSTISFHILSNSFFTTTLPFDVIMEIPVR